MIIISLQTVQLEIQSIDLHLFHNIHFKVRMKRHKFMSPLLIQAPSCFPTAKTYDQILTSTTFLQKGMNIL